MMKIDHTFVEIWLSGIVAGIAIGALIILYGVF